MRKKSPASVQKWVDSIQIPPPPPGTTTVPSTVTVIDPDEPGPSGLSNADLPDHQMTASAPDCLMEPHPATISEDEDHVLTTPQTPAPPPPMVSSSDEEYNPSEEMASTAPVAAADHKPEVGSGTGITTSSSISIKNLLSKKTLLEKFSRSATNLEQEQPAAVVAAASPAEPTSDHGHEEAPESRKSTSLASIGKIKINEFYDKLSMNKAKYGLIKAKKLELRNFLAGGSASQRQTPVEEALPEMVVEVPPEVAIEQTGEVHQQQQVGGDAMESDGESRMMQSEASGKLSTGDIYEFSFDESFPKDEDIIPDVVSETDEEKENLDIPLHQQQQQLQHHQHQHHHHYLNPPMVAAAGTTRMGIGKIGRSSSENPRANKRFNLMEIGRSFSEMNDDDNFVISECNNSCPNPSSLNTSSSINNSTSNILARSVPVSPIPRTSSKLSIQQENNSLSESPRRRSAMLMKDSSLQSDSSRCSSVESLLNARKPDPERILLNLGFGPAPHSTDVLSKIPKRFLKPSQVRGVDTEAFLRQQQLSMHIHENSVLGYRGLVGNPHIPPSMIVAKIMERFQENERGRMARGGSIPGGTIDLQQAAGMSGLHHHHHHPASSSRESSGPPSPIPIPRHSSLASAEGRIKF